MGVNVSALEKSHKELLGALKQIQFGFMFRRCPACAGWNMSPNGETDMVHVLDCPVYVAIKNAEEFYD
jgi:hypothetical protein